MRKCGRPRTVRQADKHTHTGHTHTGHTHTDWHTLVAQLVRRASAGDWIKDKVMYEFNALTYLAAAKVVYL